MIKKHTTTTTAAANQPNIQERKPPTQYVTKTTNTCRTCTRSRHLVWARSSITLARQRSFGLAVLAVPGVAPLLGSLLERRVEAVEVVGLAAVVTAHSVGHTTSLLTHVTYAELRPCGVASSAARHVANSQRALSLPPRAAGGGSRVGRVGGGQAVAPRQGRDLSFLIL